MIKRLLATACAAVMLITLAACGDKSDQKDEASESGSQKAATLSVEKTFEKEFEAAKAFDIDALAEIEYFINFGNGVDKEKYAVEGGKLILAYGISWLVLMVASFYSEMISIIIGFVAMIVFAIFWKKMHDEYGPV